MVSVLSSLFVFSFILIKGTYSKWIQGTLQTQTDWEFLTRFCFLSQEGAISYELQYPVGYAPQEMLLYYDTPGQWDAVYNRGRNCTDSRSVLSEKNNQVIRLTEESVNIAAYSGCVTKERDGEPWFYCSGIRGFKSSRERWWYIAISRCTRNNVQLSGMYLEYKVHMTNGDDLLHQEFSADEFYILPVDIAFFLVYIILCVLSIICAIVLRVRQLFHTTYKLYLVAVFTWAFHLLLMVIAWGHHGSTGWEIRQVESVGRIFRAASTVIFILMLILMAKGFTITRGRLTRISAMKITFFFCAYVVFIMVLFIWEGLLFDPAQVLYYYECPPGYGMVLMHLLGWLWFLYATVFTLKHFKSHQKFYIPFFSFFTIWFWAAPIMVLIAMFVMPKWSREKTVNGVEQFIGFCGHIFFLILTRPNAANKNFPYHIRTSQINFIQSETEAPKSGNPYIVSSGVSYAGSGPNLEFFITSKNVDKHTPGSHGEGPVVASRSSVTLTLNQQTLGSQHEGRHTVTVSSTTSSHSGNGNTTIINSNINVNNNCNYPQARDPPSQIAPFIAAPSGPSDVAINSDFTLAPLRKTLLPPLVPSAPPYGTLALLNSNLKSFH
ncbi:transmembrane protein 145 [Biomphalaria pfeifferi]|uniref:Transmembrane protein 145 n=1 Tax=Biomphalaria pfeifferi TaxID=112525 RepID=A0AAD8BHX8_BIOPF|nr:transmembrane protein 145 [Biomphalaria pfeifferi]